MQSFDAIIVGCGAYGSSVSYYLTSLGMKTLTIEQFNLNHNLGSSHGKTRIIRTAYAEGPIYVPLVIRARELWFELSKLCGKEVICLTGGLQVGRADGFLINGAETSAKKHGIEYEKLSPSEIKDRFRGVFSPDKDQVGMYEKGAGVLFPERCIEAYVRLAEEKGAVFSFSNPLVKWTYNRSEGNFAVVTAGESYTSRYLVLTAGSWLSKLVPELALPLFVERQNVFWMGAVKDRELLSPNLKMPIFIFEEGRELFYGIPDFGDGLKVGKHHGGQLSSKPEDIDRTIRDEDERELRTFLGKRIPSANGDVLASSVCIYTNTPDGNFIVDHHPEYENLWILSACSGHGFKFASSIGKTVADLIAGKGAEFDLAQFSLKRFTKSS